MATGNESDGGGVGVKKRQALSKANSFGPESNSGYPSGYTTDESAVSRDASRRERKQRRGGRRADVDGNRASILWMVFAVGLLFCLMDAMYISRVLERGGSTNDAESQSAASVRVLGQLKKDAEGKGALAATLDKLGVGKSLHQGGHQKLTREQQHMLSIEQQQALKMKNMTPEQRKQKREEEKKEAEAQRIRNIKAAALEALKAQHGGKIPDDMMDSVLGEDESFTPRPMEYYKEKAIADDKTKILDLFIDAGLKEMDDSTYAVLPSWNDVSSLYGENARIIGLDQCETFQKKGNPWDHFVSTAGMFNSGTNLMAEMLIHNCHMQERMDKLGAKNRGIRWQVPWGKHTPPGDEEYRLEHKSIKDQGVDANMILPAVTVRDPYYWMQSMCKHHYTASWRSSDRCPNLTPSEMDKANYPVLRDKDHFPVSVKYADFRKQHESLTGLWNDWYGEYRGVEFQRLFVRYEDLLFHPREIAESVCHCAGGTMNQGKFNYVVDSAKKGLGAHGKVRTGYIDAIIKYGSERNRYNGYHPEDLAYARTHLDETFMEQLGYKFHPIELESANAKKGEGEADAGNEHEDEMVEHKEEHEAPDIPELHPDEKEVADAEESADLGEKER